MDEKSRAHRLKTWPPFFQDVVDGIKTFEYRRNDRGFQVGDRLILIEYIPPPQFKGIYTGRTCVVRITYIVSDAPGLPVGYVVMGIEKEASDG